MLIAILCAALCAGPASAQIRAVNLQPPARDFGYFAGGLLSATAVIDVGPDTVLDAASIPAEGPVAAAIDVRRVSVSQTRIAGGSQVVIRITYQSFASPEQVSQADIPGYSVAFLQGGRRLTATVQGFGFTVSPFRHDLQPVLDASVLRPDHPAEPVDAAPLLRVFVAGCTVAAASGLALSLQAGWRMRRGRGPFADAARHVAGLARHGGTSEGALLALHRAFDTTAGRRMFADDLDDFLTRHPQYLPLRGDVEAFFAASRSIFFGSAAEAPPWPVLTRLSRNLMQAERRT